MALQHAENLLRRYKGQIVVVKTMSGGTYEGRVTEITNDFVELIDSKRPDEIHIFLLFQAIESLQVPNVSTGS